MPQRRTLITNILLESGQYKANISITDIFNQQSTILSTDFTVVGTTGMIETIENSPQIFPNPVASKLTINDKKNARISIYDLNGKLVINKTLESTTETIDVNNLTSGFYLITITDNKISKNCKLIKQ